MQIMPIVEITNNVKTGNGLCVSVRGASETLSLAKAQEFRDTVTKMVNLLEMLSAEAETTK